MKRFLSFLLTAPLLVAVYSQNPTKTNCYISSLGQGANTFLYTYDFSNLTPYNDCFLKPRHNKDKIYVLVNNINLLAYEIQATGTSTSIPLSNISLFDSLVSKLNAASLSAATPAVDGVRKSKTIDGSKRNPRKMVAVPKDDPYVEQKQRIGHLQQSINANFPSLVTDLQQLEHFSKFAKNVPLLIGSECCSQTALTAALLTEPNLGLFSGGIPDLNTLRSVINTTPVATVTDLKTKEKTIRESKKEIDALLTEIRKSCKKSKTQDQDICDVDELENNFPVDLDKALAQAEKVTTTGVSDVVTELNDLLSKVANVQNFRYLSRQLPAQGDELQIKIGYKPKPLYAARFTADTIDFTIPVKGKFEWSIGPALNFHLSKSLFNYSYRIDSAYGSNGMAKNDTFLIRRNSIRNQFIPSVGVMAHFYWQNHTALTPGITIGLSTSPTTLSDLKAYLGGSLLIGSLNNKLILSAGLAGGSVDRLKANLMEGENPKTQVPFTGEKLASSQELVEKAFRVGFYFGFTYKLNN